MISDMVYGFPSSSRLIFWGVKVAQLFFNDTYIESTAVFFCSMRWFLGRSSESRQRPICTQGVCLIGASENPLFIAN